MGEAAAEHDGNEAKGEEGTTVKEEAVKERAEETMKPWEQHSAVISIPRFDYNAPSTLLHHSLSGFLITCTIKREKSATKEAISILEKVTLTRSGGLESSVESSGKRRKICTENTNGQSVNYTETNSREIRDETCDTATASDASIDKSLILSLVKLTRSGLVLFTYPKDTSRDTVSIVWDLIHSLEIKSSSPPLWCHRIFPIQATCSLNEKDLKPVVTKLVLQFLNNEQNKVSRPVKFAVGYNRRGIEETEMMASKGRPDCYRGNELLDRNKCFSVVAAAVKDVVSDSVVDLKSPELSVLVELLPLSGLPTGSLVVGVSVLPRDMVTTKPRLCVRALVSESRK